MNKTKKMCVVAAVCLFVIAMTAMSVSAAVNPNIFYSCDNASERSGTAAIKTSNGATGNMEYTFAFGNAFNGDQVRTSIAAVKCSVVEVENFWWGKNGSRTDDSDQAADTLSIVLKGKLWEATDSTQHGARVGKDGVNQWQYVYGSRG